MLRAVNLTKSYGAQLVLDSCTFDVGVGQRLALVGYNGAGKTTLLKVLAGVEQPDSGSVSLQAGTVVGYLPQDGAALGNDTVERYLRAAAGLDDASWAAQRYRAETILSGFGLGDVAMGEQLTNLSSGQRTKVALAGILLRPADLLLLDEPTNNLDLPALLWLEEYLAASASTVVVVSHDRRFLDCVANGVMELDWRTQRVAIEAGSYSAYLDRQREARAHQLLRYRQQREEIAQLEGEIVSKKAVASKPFKRKQPKDNDKYTDSFKSDRTQIKFGRVAKNLDKRIEHIDAVERPVERQPLTIDLAALPRGGNRDIELVGAEARYPSFHLGPIDLHIAFGNRVAMVGPNGSGKSTLLKVLTGKLEPAAGKVSVGSGVCFGQLMQEHENLPRTESPVRFIASRVAVEEHDIFARLVQSGFSREQVRQPIADLSPGGRARLTLVYFSYLAVNTLVLDEPTNHLDLEAMEALDELLLSYVGTVVLVTHDRYFLERARPSYVYQIDGGKLKLVLNLDALVSDSVTRARKLLRQLNSV